MIAAQDLHAAYRDRAVLRGVTLRLADGELTGVIGPNGAGKSSLLKVLARLLPPSRGTVTLGGRDLYRTFSARQAARRVALLPQDEAAAFPLTVRELVGLGRTPYLNAFGWFSPADVRAVDRAVSALGLRALAERPLGELSGGERKRASVARALAQEASVLLLDEPAAHLDPGHAAALFAVLRRLARAGRTVMVAAHELSLLAHHCDRLLLVDRGRVVLDGRPKRVLASAVTARAFGVPRGSLRGWG